MPAINFPNNNTMTSRTLATAAVAAFCLASGGVPVVSPYYAAQDGHPKDTEHDTTNRHRTLIDTTPPKNTKKSNGTSRSTARTRSMLMAMMMGVDAFSPITNTFSSVRPRRRSMHILSYRPDQASQTDQQAGPMLWQYIFFANWDETYVRVLKSPQESTYVSPNGWTPLHLLMTSSGFPPPLKVVKAVYAAFPQALRMPTNDYGRTPLDLAKRTDQPKEIIDFLENPPKLEGDDEDYYVRPRAFMADDLDDGVCIDIDEDGACIVVEDDDDDTENDNIKGHVGVNNQVQDTADHSSAYEEGSPQPQSSQARAQASPSRPTPPKKVSVDSTINQQVEEQKRYQEQLRRKLEQRQMEEQMEYEQYQDRYYYSQQTMMMEEERRRQQFLMEQQQEEAMQRQRRQYIEQQKQQQQGFAPRQPFHSAMAANTASGSSSNVAGGVNGKRQGAAPAGMSSAQQANQAATQRMMAPLQDRIEELTTRYDALIRTKEGDAAKIESLEKELQTQRDMERQMRSAHYAEIIEAQEAAEERLVEYKKEIERLKEQLGGTSEGETNGSKEKKNDDDEQNIDGGDEKVKAKLEAHDAAEVEDLREQITLLTKELKEKNAEIKTLKKEKESDRIELEKRLEDAAKMLTTVLKPTAVKKEAASSAGKGFGNKRKSP